MLSSLLSRGTESAATIHLNNENPPARCWGERERGEAGRERSGQLCVLGRWMVVGRGGLIKTHDRVKHNVWILALGYLEKAGSCGAMST